MALSDEQRREFGERLAQLRGPMPQRKAAERIGITERAYRTWEAGVTEPHWENLEAAAQAFKVSINFLLYGSESPPQAPGSQLDRIETEVMRQGEILDALLEAETVRQDEKTTRSARRAKQQARGTPRAAGQLGGV